ncbi:MAG: metallophosphoesterase, partial [Oscillospiraceae bacterium]|nr:metallophosphoesterase [Oscillospiraceae bacterium]
MNISRAMNIKGKLKKLIAASAICCIVASAALPASALTSRPPTEPEEGDAFSFLYFGDIQVTQSAEYDFAEWGRLAKSAVRSHPDAAFALQGGDIVESGIDRAQWDAFIKNTDDALGDMPFFPTNGNHESNFFGGKPELYLEVFELPENGPEGFSEEFYSFDYGDAHITVLNSWVFSG